MSQALLIIDIQAGLCTGKYAVFEAERVIGNVNRISEQARAQGVPVVVIQHEEDEGSLVYNSAGWQLAESLVATPQDVFIRKGASDSFHKTELQAKLQSLGITELIVCGMQSDFCVNSTVRRGLALGYPITLVSDAHSTLDNSVLTAEQIIAHHNETLSQLSSFGVRAQLKTTEEVLSR
ncbi:MAG TPA: cysteine hydrolase family protein [Burkholderiaceae bacterium]|jgi:nicotinamidase-related amidase